jgi:hypothetical protein
MKTDAIHPLAIEHLPIASLKPDRRNPRHHSTACAGSVTVGSLSKFQLSVGPNGKPQSAPD